MALGKEYFESLGLEIAKRKYYNAAKVEGVIEDFSRRTAELARENAALRERAEELSCGREEIGEAILSAKTISQRLIADARESAEAILAEAREKADAALAEAREKAEALVAEAEEKARSLAVFEGERDQRTIRGAEDCYLRVRAQLHSAQELLDGEWQRFLCAFGEDEGNEERLPEDLDRKLSLLAENLSALSGDGDEPSDPA